MKILVCGGRDYNNKEHLYHVLDKANYDGDIEICHGGANGADNLAEKWATDRQVNVTVFPANWALGRVAGPIRNQKMLETFKPDMVIAFPGGRGTADMIRKARKAGVPVYIQDF
jgi:hypothetical protein